MLAYDAVIFDLDGTLLNTLDDLTAAVNHAMRESGYPERTRAEVQRFVGNGVAMLIRRALPCVADGDEAAFEETLQAFKRYYALHNCDVTAPYEGVKQMLNALKGAGVKLAVVSNKNDPNVKALCRRYFESEIALAVGEKEGVRPKPAPDTVLQVMREWNLKPKRTLYVGDSDVDIQTAKNAGVDCAAVCWGFRTQEQLKNAGATLLVHTPAEIESIVTGK